MIPKQTIPDRTEAVRALVEYRTTRTASRVVDVLLVAAWVWFWVQVVR